MDFKLCPNYSSRFNIAGINHPTILATLTPEAEIQIGNRVGISGAILVARKQVTLGDDVMLGVNVRIYDNDFHPVDVKARIADDKDQIVTAPVVLGRSVWVGANAIILKGVTIGDRSIVAAGAVVTRSFPSDVIVGGNPARVIKHI